LFFFSFLPMLSCSPAEARDVPGVQQLLGGLQADGFALPFSVDDVPGRLADVTVIEREGKVGWKRGTHGMA
jgi:N-acetylglutamate synthase-like GNAT family acetyltransferase